MSKRAIYEPTAEQIREGCLEIQKSWDDDERLRRSLHFAKHSSPLILEDVKDAREDMLTRRVPVRSFAW